MLPLTDEQRATLEEAMPFAHKQAWTIVERTGMEFDVALSGVCFGYIDAIQRWSADNGAKFTTFAYPRGEGRVKDDKRLQRRWFKAHRDNQPDMGWLDEPVGDGGVCRADYLRAAECTAVEDADAFETLIDGLTEREQRVLRMYYVDCLDQKQIGRQFGLTESAIHKIRRGALNALKASLQ